MKHWGIGRVNRDTPCQLDGAHHPHRYECTDAGCSNDGYCGYWELLCCVCDETWPCSTKREHVDAHRAPA